MKSRRQVTPYIHILEQKNSQCVSVEVYKGLQSGADPGFSEEGVWIRSGSRGEVVTLVLYL